MRSLSVSAPWDLRSSELRVYINRRPRNGVRFHTYVSLYPFNQQIIGVPDVNRSRDFFKKNVINRASTLHGTPVLVICIYEISRKTTLEHHNGIQINCWKRTVLVRFWREWLHFNCKDDFWQETYTRCTITQINTPTVWTCVKKN